MKFKLIQVFRGIAALLVILYHLIAHMANHFNYSLFDKFFKFGLAGVDFFFVLSGFIITYVHYNDLVSKGDWSNFFKKRIIRVYPLYWVIAIISVVIFVFMTPNRMKDAGLTMDLTSPYILGSLVRSFLLIPQQGMYLVGVAWTLSYEVLFYLVFGICIIMGYRFARVTLLSWFLLVMLNGLLFKTGNFYIDFLLNPIIIEFMMGCLVAYLVIKRVVIPIKLLYILLPVLLVIISNVIQLNGLSIERTLLYVLLLGALFSACTYIAVKTDEKHPPIKYPALLLLLGDASYSIYLFHQTLYSSLVRIYQKIALLLHFQLPVVVLAIVILIITLAVSILIHLFVEKPILRFLNNRFTRTKRNTSLQVVRP